MRASPIHTVQETGEVREQETGEVRDQETGALVHTEQKVGAEQYIQKVSYT